MDIRFRFMKFRKIAGIFSITLFIVSLVSLGLKGLSLGLDFSGGTQIEISYKKPVSLEEIRNTLKNNGYDDAQVTNLDTNLDVRIKVADQSGDSSIAECVSLLLDYEGPFPIECDDLRKLKKDKKLPEKIELINIPQ